MHTPEEYVPDGLTVDSEGYIWSAKWDGWKVIRYAPDGSIDQEIAMPVQRPTSCMFGGADLVDLYARAHYDPDRPLKSHEVARFRYSLKLQNHIMNSANNKINQS